MKNYKRESKEFFDKVAFKKHGNSKNLHTYILNNIFFNKDDIILDLGCGKGDFIDILVEKEKPFKKIYALDISENMIEILKKKEILNCHPVIGDSENLNFQEKYFDKIFCLNSFHHYPNPKGVVSEVKKVLKENGSIYVGEVYVPGVIREVINIFLPLGRCGDYKMYSPKTLNKIFEKEGFVEIRKKHIFSFLFISEFKKDIFKDEL